MTTLLRRYLLVSLAVAAIATATVLTVADPSHEVPRENVSRVGVESTTDERADAGRASETSSNSSLETLGETGLGTPGDILNRVAVDYRSFGRVDEGRGHWTPVFCKPPTGPTAQPSVARFSESDDQSTHGRKLYFLFAKDAEAYREMKTPQPVGQILVKETWMPRQMPLNSAPDKSIHREYDSGGPPLSDAGGVRGGYFPYVEKDGRWYRAGERAGLFVMMKLATESPETDNGWVYGTVDREGEVTSLGRIASCMGCHVQAEHDRLFGLPRPADDGDSYEMQDPDRVFDARPQPNQRSSHE